MAKLPEVKKLFEGKKELKGQGTKDFLIDEEITIKAYAIGTKDDKQFAVMLFDHKGTEYTGAFGDAVMKRLQDAETSIGVNQKGEEKYFKEPITATIKSIKSEKGRNYFTIN